MIVGFVPLAAVGGLESAGTASPCRGPLAAHHPPPLLRTNAPFPRVSITPSCLWLGGIEAPVCDS